MAYASVISLKQTIERLLGSYTIQKKNLKILISAHKKTVELKKVLQKRASSSRKTDAFDEEIREAVRKLEDTLESHISNVLLISQYEEMVEGQHSSKLPLDTEGVNQEVVSFTERMKKKVELGNLLWPDDDDDHDDDEEEVVSSSTNITASFPGLKSSQMVGLSYDCNKIKDMLRCSTEGRDKYLFNCGPKIIALLGMAGIGKTALAFKVFEEIRSDYELSAFVTVGPKCKTRETMRRILAQMNHRNVLDIDKILSHEGDEIVAQCLQTSLQNRKYLIVMDDLWSTEYWNEIKSTLPNNENGSRVLLTTRRGAVARGSAWDIHEMRFLNKQESWDLLRYNVFGTEESCPFELEKSGRKIAENCDGLPLAIVTVARFLSKVERTVVSWNKETNKQSLVFKDALDEMSEVLFLSYEYLSLQLKACFQYMGVFPEDCEITFSKVAKLWVAERFIEENSSNGLSESFNRKCLKELVSDSLVLVKKQSSTRGIKTFRLHFVFWHLCVREAAREKFLHIVNSLPNSFKQGVTSERRLCIYNNALFGFEEVYEHSTEDNVNSTVRSLLCTGPHHQYPIPVHLQYFRLLRVLDALTIRFYEFPFEIVKLVLLRYLALTSNRELPASISKLWNLEYLIIHQHLSIKSSGSACLYLPMEIWDMQELNHLEVVGCDLPEPDPTYGGGGDLLPRLETLLGVSPQSCIEGVLARIPVLKKLGIKIELAPDHDIDDEEPWNLFDHLCHLYELKSLTCVMLNHNLMSPLIGPFPSRCIELSLLEKLSLSGIGYPWEQMKILGGLLSLKVLKLRCYAFRGPKWDTDAEEFIRLDYLLLEDTDLEHWGVHTESFWSLRTLIIRHCYKLEKLAFRHKKGKLIERIELVDCPLAEASVRELQEIKQSIFTIREFPFQGETTLQVSIQSTWDEKTVKS